MASRPIVVAVFSTVYVHRQGWSMPAYLFSFFPLCAFEGCQMHEEHFILFCNALVLISMSCIFVWSLNRVGCEIWDLSRNHKCHVSAVKCRHIFDLSLGAPWISKVFAFIWIFYLLREQFWLHALYYPSHVCWATYSCTLLPLTSLSFSSICSLFFFLLLWCASLSLYVCRMATLHSWSPRAKVTPQLCSTC